MQFSGKLEKVRKAGWTGKIQEILMKFNQVRDFKVMLHSQFSSQKLHGKMITEDGRNPCRKPGKVRDKHSPQKVATLSMIFAIIEGPSIASPTLSLTSVKPIFQNNT